MSSDEPIVSSTGHHIEVAMINETDCPTIADNAANDRQSDRKSETAEANQSGPNCEVLGPAPPPRKLNRTGSVRRTNKTTDATDTAIASDQISDSSPPSDTHFKSGDNESASPVIITSRGATHEVPTTKSESTLKDNATQCVSTDLIGYKSNVNSYRIHPMERMRRWVTSDEAKEKRRQRLNRCLHYLKVFLAHLFSTTGLCLLVVAYSCAGAVIFTYVESPNEVKHRKTIEKERSECAHQIWNYTMEMNVIYPDLLSKEIDKRLAQFEKKVVKAVREGGYDGIGVSEQWTFSGALLYSVTVITTIGYGNVTCQTALGRVVTMVYALFGIPVMFLCLANLGNLMAQTFRFSYRRICCFCCFAATNRCNKRKETKANKSSLNTQNEKIELKNCSPNANQKDIKLVFDESDDQKVRSIIELMPSTPPTVSSVSSSSISSPLKSQLSNDDHKEIVVVKENRVGSLESGEDRVPIWLVTLLVISYIMAGASMFSIWEGWDFDEGAYFCFTTLTTIGFGDFVPGSAKYSEDAQGQTKFIICCAYLIVGLSLLAMSFNLVQEEIVIKAKELGRKIGIISKSECDSSVSV